jgi:flagellar basal body-associated protein FliL
MEGDTTPATIEEQVPQTQSAAPAPAATPPTNPTPAITPSSTIPTEKKSKMWLWIIIGVVIIGTIIGIIIIIPSGNQQISSVNFENIPEITSASSCKTLTDAMKAAVEDSCAVDNLVNVNMQFMEKGENFNDMSEEDKTACEEYAMEVNEFQIETCGQERFEEAGKIIVDEMIGEIKDQLSGSTGCFDASAALSIKTDSSSVDPDTNTVTVQVHRGTGDFELVAVEIIMGHEGSTIAKRETEVPSVNGEKIYTFTRDDLDNMTISEASVAAIIQEGDVEKTCDKTGMVSISQTQS